MKDKDIESAVYEYADTHLFGYRTRRTSDGVQLIAPYCPICGGGDGWKRDKWTFAIGTNGLANCKRGTCGWTGTLTSLLKLDGEFPQFEMKRGKEMRNSYKQKKKYVLPKTELFPLTDKCREYLHLRGFSDETIDSFDLKSDKEGNIVFVFYKGGQLTYLKFRKPEKYVKGSGKPKEWQESQTEPVLWNMDKVSFNQPLVLTEGQADCMAVYEAGFTNVTSVPCGCENLDWIDNCWDFVSKVKTWILFGDSDAPGQEMVETLKQRLSMAQILYIPLEAYPSSKEGHICKDANEILVRFGAEKIVDMIGNAEEAKVEGLIDFADIEDEDPTTTHRIPFGIPGLDDVLGGLEDGGISIVTGDTGSGKSTTLGITVINAIEHGEKVCVYSGELPKKKYRRWLIGQAAGDEWIGLKYDPIKGKDVPFIEPDVKKRIGERFREKLFLYDTETDAKDGIVNSVVRIFETASRRYGAKLMVVDNLMSLTFGEDGDENAIQSQMVQKMKEFAIKNSCHVLIVAHLRKVSSLGRREVTFHDVQGSSTSVKAADSVILVENQRFKVLKNRDEGTLKTIEFCYCPASRRVYQANMGDRLVCHWDKTGMTPPAVRADSFDQYRVIPPPSNDPI